MQPYVVSKITDADGQLVEEIQPTVKRWVLSEETSAVVRELMEGGVQTGTGKNALVPGCRVGGKSGTSQKLDSEDSGARIVVVSTDPLLYLILQTQTILTDLSSS